MSAGFAFDLPSSSAIADALLSARTALCGQPWRTFASGYASSLTVRYKDDNDPGVTSIYRPKAFGASGSQQLNYMLVAATGRTLRAKWRRAICSTAATARGFIGCGFVDANGNGYAGGWNNDATPQAQYAIAKISGDGSITAIAAWLSRLPYQVTTYARLSEFEYDRQTGAMRFFWDSTAVAIATDTAYSPIYPCIVAHDMATSTSLDLITEAMYEQTGSLAATVTSALAWRAYGSRDWVGEATVNFATDPTYTLQTGTLLQDSIRVQAKKIVLSSFDASAAVTLSIDGASSLTIEPGAEIVLDAPPSARALALAGTTGVVRVRLYTGDYTFTARVA